MMTALEKIATYEILGRSRCDTILDILSKCQNILGVRRLIPENEGIEDKTGELFDVGDDVGTVRVTDKQTIFSIMADGINQVQNKMFSDRFVSQSPR
jgi:hypothetical protein